MLLTFRWWEGVFQDVGRLSPWIDMDTFTAFPLFCGKVRSVPQGCPLTAEGAKNNPLSALPSPQLCNNILSSVRGWFWGMHPCRPVNLGCSACLLCLHSNSHVAEVLAILMFPILSGYNHTTCSQGTVRLRTEGGSRGDYICCLETLKEALETLEL